MCGRYSLHLPIHMIAEEFDFSESMIPDFGERFNIAPTQMVPVITNESPSEVQLFRWGLVPFWAKTIAIGSKMINARAETLLEKPAFKNLLKKRRCLILADGFYEWKKEGKEKTPHLIEKKTGGLITFAGLWDIWKDAEGREKKTFTIITTQPNSLMVPIHDRMPAIIEKENRKKWLSESLSADDAVLMLGPAEAAEYQARPVSNKLNKAAYDAADILE